MKYRKNPVVIEAYQTDKEMDIETLEGTMHASVGDYIITGVRGEKYPCKPDIFEQTYEPADASASPWHRVEEPPKEGTWCVIAKHSYLQPHNLFYDIAHYLHGTFSVYDSGIGDWFDGKPLYWMPIEPPKEDA